MAQTFKYATIGSVINLLVSTDMNSKAVNTIIGPGTEIDNTTNQNLIGKLTLTLGSAAFVAGNYMDVFLVPSGDLAGANYPTFTSVTAGAFSNYRVATIYINGSTAAQVEGYQDVRIPPGKFKTYAITNGSCPTLAASGNALDIYPTNIQAV